MQIALSFDEEIGCTGAPPMIEAMQPVLPKGTAAIIGEPSSMQAVTGHNGGIGFTTHVVGFEVHSSILHKGVNAIMAGAKLIEWANQMNTENMAAKPTALAAMFDPPFTTVHVGTIKGGTAENITAKDCRFGLGFRVVPGEDKDKWAAAYLEKVREVEEQMQAVVPETRIEVRQRFDVPGLQPEEDGGGGNPCAAVDRGQREPQGDLWHRGRAVSGGGLFRRDLRPWQHRTGPPAQ